MPPAVELRRNMALLIKWLHPDMDRPGDQSMFVHRVTMAWDDLKTADRRAAYDARRAQEARKPASRSDASEWPALETFLRLERGISCRHERVGCCKRALSFSCGAKP
jgi:hypothetical protein